MVQVRSNDSCCHVIHKFGFVSMVNLDRYLTGKASLAHSIHCDKHIVVRHRFYFVLLMEINMVLQNVETILLRD